MSDTEQNHVTREELAATIHNATLGVLRWDSLPESPRNPQRHHARNAADAVLAKFDVSPKGEQQ